MLSNDEDLYEGERLLKIDQYSGKLEQTEV
jgi:hypothetical protein